MCRGRIVPGNRTAESGEEGRLTPTRCAFARLRHRHALRRFHRGTGVKLRTPTPALPPVGAFLLRGDALTSASTAGRASTARAVPRPPGQGGGRAYLRPVQDLVRSGWCSPGWPGPDPPGGTPRRCAPAPGGRVRCPSVEVAPGDVAPGRRGSRCRTSSRVGLLIRARRAAAVERAGPPPGARARRSGWSRWSR